eukprot:5547589-Amphidinium_carterae.3
MASPSCSFNAESIKKVTHYGIWWREAQDLVLDSHMLRQIRRTLEGAYPSRGLPMFLNGVLPANCWNQTTELPRATVGPEWRRMHPCGRARPPTTALRIVQRSDSLGAALAVANFCRLAEWLTRAARRFFHLAVEHFYDDFFLVEPSTTSSVAQRCLHEFFRTLGFQLDPRKSQPPTTNAVILGVHFDLQHVCQGLLQVHAKPERVQQLTAEMQNVLDRGFLSPSHAAKLVGKADIVNSTLFGRVGRAALSVLRARQYQQGRDWALSNARPHAFAAVDRGSISRCAFAPTSPQCGTLTSLAPLLRWLCRALQDPQALRTFRVVASWIPKRQMIGQVDLFGAVLGLLAFRATHFVDNDGWN